MEAAFITPCGLCIRRYCPQKPCSTWRWGVFSWSFGRNSWNPVIVENVASSYGGGVALLSAKGIIGTNKDVGEAAVIVTNNQAIYGGLYVTGGTPTLSRVNILENTVGTKRRNICEWPWRWDICGKPGGKTTLYMPGR